MTETPRNPVSGTGASSPRASLTWLPCTARRRSKGDRSFPPPRPVALLMILVPLVVLATATGNGAAVAEPVDTDPPAAQVAKPAKLATVAKARNLRKDAVRARKRLCRVRRCLRGSVPSAVRKAPPRAASEASWRSYAMRVRAQRDQYRSQSARGLERIRRSGGSGTRRWLPLARWVGWPERALPTLQRVMWHESRGNPRAVNRWSGCAGLLQIHPIHHVARPLDPEVNLRAGLRLYRAAGWQPWGM